MPEARKSIDIDARPDQVYELIVDFASYPNFVPNQSAARVLQRDGDRWRVEFELSVARKLRYVLDLTGEPSRGVRWSLVSGDMMKAMSGGWELEELPGGRTRATYSLDVELSAFVPRSISKLLIERTLPANLEAFKREAERRT
jgi:ribosome-associated toxin RatA of RatAB toxin-antitoxin module